MLNRNQCLDLARNLAWELGYVREDEAFPAAMARRPWLPLAAWSVWDEPFRTTYAAYVATQSEKDLAVEAVREVVGKCEDYARLPVEWRSALELHAATLPLAEFAAVVGNLRAARFGRASAWRGAALLGALDEFRHTQIPLALIHELLLVEHDRAYAQALADKWFWRSFQLFAVVTGFAIDYLTPLESRTLSFREFMNEWISIESTPGEGATFTVVLPLRSPQAERRSA